MKHFECVATTWGQDGKRGAMYAVVRERGIVRKGPKEALLDGGGFNQRMRIEDVCEARAESVRRFIRRSENVLESLRADAIRVEAELRAAAALLVIEQKAEEEAGR